MKFEITDQVKTIAEVAMYLVIEIVLLATYSNALTINSDYDAYRGLSLTGSVFMMLGFLVMIGLHFKYIEYAIYGLLALMSFGVFLLLIGMGMVSSYEKNLDFNEPIGLWFIQVSLLVLGFVILKKLHYQNKSEPPQESKPQ